MIYLKGAIGSLILAFLLLFAWKALDNSLSTQKKPERYDVIDVLEKEGMVDFELPRLDGSTFSLDSVKGKVVMINFWASWCEPCIKEYPSMTRLTNTLDGELIFLAISNDENKEDIETFLGAMGEPSPHTVVLWDKDRTVADLYGVERLPETFIFRRDQKLDRKVIGQLEWFEEGAVDYMQYLTTLE